MGAFNFQWTYISSWPTADDLVAVGAFKTLDREEVEDDLERVRSEEATFKSPTLCVFATDDAEPTKKNETKLSKL
jgi:hypothetical protein